MAFFTLFWKYDVLCFQNGCVWLLCHTVSEHLGQCALYSIREVYFVFYLRTPDKRLSETSCLVSPRRGSVTVTVQSILERLGRLRRGRGWWSWEHRRCGALCTCEEGIKTNLLYLTQNLLLNQTEGCEGSKCAFNNLCYKQTIICTIKPLGVGRILCSWHFSPWKKVKKRGVN